MYFCSFCWGRNIMKKYIDRIMDDIQCEIFLKESISDLFKNGAVDITQLELLSAIKLNQPQIFAKYENQILVKMGLFFKSIKIETFEDQIFQILWDYINEYYNSDFTPTQIDIIEKIENNQVYSFSSPTSTGKSYIFRYLISFFKSDIVIIVPSRALINEYYKKVSEIFTDKDTNVLTFVDIINTNNAKRSIFIITPERTKDLFNNKEKLDVGLILFDEAQLSDESSVRGMYYDSVVRRAVLYFPNSRFIFAYPFISNPEVQFTRNNIEIANKDFKPYKFMNVGQIYYSFNDTGNFFNFGVNTDKSGSKVVIDYDPLEEVILNNGSALVYCAKTQIYDGRIKKRFKKYIDLCDEISNVNALDIIEKIRVYIGASNKTEGNYVSEMINSMKRGIVFHHGSLPLRVRILIEEFTQKRYCKICFATATLEQGINMPFDLVWIDKFEPSKPLDVKNLVGRAGRSTNLPIFDYGKVVIKDTSRIQLSKIIRDSVSLNEISELDKNTDSNDDYKEYKEAIKNNTFSEEYNLTDSEIERIETKSIDHVEKILTKLYVNGEIDYSSFSSDENTRNIIVQSFIDIYVDYLNRDLVPAEEYILTTTVKILFWRVQGKNFNQIVSYRYAYAAQTKYRRDYEKEIENSTDLEKIQLINEHLNNLKAKRLTMFGVIPNKKLYPKDINYDNKKKTQIRATEVDFDRIVVDTYDYIDKLIGFRLGDVYFAAFDKYSKNLDNNETLRKRASTMTNFIKYGTDDGVEIWLLRYGFEFEDFDWLIPLVDSVDEREIKFKNLPKLSEEQYDKIKKFI